jgi:hypothetical protein
VVKYPPAFELVVAVVEDVGSEIAREADAERERPIGDF